MALIQINRFQGINEAVDKTLLTEEGVIVHNADVRHGVLRATKKPLKMDSVQLPNIKTLLNYYTASGSFLLASTSNSLYKLTGNTWTALTTSKNGGSCDYINNNIDGQDIIVISNGVDNVYKYDGAEIKELKMLGKSSDYSDLSNRAPKGAFLGLHYERLWIASDNFLYCSSVTANGGFDIEDFTTPTEPEWEVNNHGAEIFMYSNDGTKIKGMTVVYDDILIFKEKKIFRLWGTTPSQMQKVELFNATGAMADKSIVSTPSGCFFVHSDGIYLYNGNDTGKISQRIDKTWESIDKNNIDKAIAAFYNNKYILAVYSKGSSIRDIIIEYDILTEQFTTRTGYGVESFADYNNTLVFASYDGYLYAYDKGDTDTIIWQSPELTMAEGATEIEAVKLHTEGTGKIEISVITEKKEKVKQVDITKDGVKYISISNTGRGVSVKLKVLEGNINVRKCYVECGLDED